MQLLKPRILSQFTLTLIGGILFYFCGNIFVIISLIFLFIYFLYDEIKYRFIKEIVVRVSIALFMFLLGVGSAGLENFWYESQVSALKKSQSAGETKITGTVIKAEEKEENVKYTIRLEGGLWKAVVYTDESLNLGDKIEVSGDVHFFEGPRNEGGFDELRFYKSSRTVERILAKKVRIVSSKRFSVSETIRRIKNKIKSIYVNALGEKNAAILSAITIGEKSSIDEETMTSFKNAGLSHILSISGMHISLLAQALTLLLKKLPIKSRAKSIITIFILICYSFFCGMSVPTLRALVMFIIGVLGFELKRNYDRLTALSIMSVIMLLVTPSLIFNAGFVFSYLVSLFLIIIGELKTKNKFITAFLLQLYTIPVIASLYYEIPTLSIFANMLLVPYLGAVLVLGLTGGLAGLIWIPMSKPILFIVKVILEVYVNLCQGLEKIPLATVVTGFPETPRLIIYYAILTACMHLLVWWNEKNVPHDKREGILGYVKELVAQKVFPKRKNIKKKVDVRFWSKTLTFRTLVCLASSCALFSFFLFKNHKGLEICFVDVGQGDGIYINIEGRQTFFIDGGSSDEKTLAKYILIPFLKYKGVKSIDYWIVSHADSDHVNGLIDMMEKNAAPKNIVISRYAVKNENLERLIGAASSCGTKVIYVDTGWNSSKTAKSQMEFLWPVTSGEDINGQSLVVLFKYKELSALFTGDISAEEELKIAQIYSEKLQNITVLKAAHHGSKYSNSKEFIDAINPKVAIISCGRNNRYGHPGQETLDNLKSIKCKILRTDEQGQIKLEYSDNSLKADSMIKKDGN